MLNSPQVTMNTLDQNVRVVSVRDFSATPGPRYREKGSYSGEEFREEFLEPEFKKALGNDERLVVDLDQTAGYASSFLEEALGGLARIYGITTVQENIEIKSDTRPWYVQEVKEYIEEANDC